MTPPSPTDALELDDREGWGQPGGAVASADGLTHGPVRFRQAWQPVSPAQKHALRHVAAVPSRNACCCACWFTAVDDLMFDLVIPMVGSCCLPPYIGRNQADTEILYELLVCLCLFPFFCFPFFFPRSWPVLLFWLPAAINRNLLPILPTTRISPLEFPCSATMDGIFPHRRQTGDLLRCWYFGINRNGIVPLLGAPQTVACHEAWP